MPAADEFKRVGDLLGDVCEAVASPGRPEDPRTRNERDQTVGTTSSPSELSRSLAQAWPEVVGAEVAANTTPVQLRAGRLVVSTSSSAWAQTLQYMSKDLSARLNQRLGTDIVSQIVFRHAGWQERRPGETAAGQSTEAVTVGALSREQEQALADLNGLALPPSVREQMERAMRASFVRTQRDSVR
jgi:hypothetical protein